MSTIDIEETSCRRNKQKQFEMAKTTQDYRKLIAKHYECN